MTLSGRQRWVAPLFLSVFVAVLGLLPHAFFSREAGRLTSFKGAYDEDTYALWAFAGGGISLPYRMLSSTALRGIWLLAARDWDAAEILADAVFPALAALLAWLLSGELTRKAWPRLLLSIGLLFGQELLSLGCAAVWNFDRGRLNLAWVRSFAGQWARGLVPDSFTSYLGLFRTPEPQVSLAIFLLTLWLLLRHFAGERGRPRRGTFWLLASLHASLAFVYFFLAAPLAILDGFIAVALLSIGRRGPALTAGGLSCLGAASVAANHFAGHVRSGVVGSPAVVFLSRLPALTPAAVLALLSLCAVAFGLWSRALARDERTAVAAGCFLTVLVLTNQQVVTGRMISVRDWERYANYPLLLVGIGLWAAASGSPLRRLPSGAGQAVAGIVVVLAGWKLWNAQARAYELFLPQNRASLAMERALSGARAGAGDTQGATLVLEEPGLAPLLEVRMRGYQACLLDYPQLFVHPIATLESTGGRRPASPFEERLFEHFARLGFSAKDVRDVLTEEVNQRSGYFLAFLFSMRDFWYPISDDRAVREAELRAMVPDVVASYTKYLASEPAAWRRPAIVLARETVRQRVTPPFWRERLLSRGSAGKEGGAVTMNAWLQTPAGQP